jgi:hypothetical protein
MAPSPKAPRRLGENIAGREALVAEVTNADLDEIDELQDEYAELSRQQADLERDIDASDDPTERKRLRAQRRDLAKELRILDTRLLGKYIETSDGERFDDETLAAIPVRVQTALMRKAAKIVYGDVGPTPERTASG